MRPSKSRSRTAGDIVLISSLQSRRDLNGRIFRTLGKREERLIVSVDGNNMLIKEENAKPLRRVEVSDRTFSTALVSKKGCVHVAEVDGNRFLYISAPVPARTVLVVESVVAGDRIYVSNAVKLDQKLFDALSPRVNGQTLAPQASFQKVNANCAVMFEIPSNEWLRGNSDPVLVGNLAPSMLNHSVTPNVHVATIRVPGSPFTFCAVVAVRDLPAGTELTSHHGATHPAMPVSEEADAADAAAAADPAVAAAVRAFLRSKGNVGMLAFQAIVLHRFPPPETIGVAHLHSLKSVAVEGALESDAQAHAAAMRDDPAYRSYVEGGGRARIRYAVTGTSVHAVSEEPFFGATQL